MREFLVLQDSTSDKELVGGPEEAPTSERSYYYDFTAQLNRYRSTDHLVKLMIEPFVGGPGKEIATCTVETRR